MAIDFAEIDAEIDAAAAKTAAAKAAVSSSGIFLFKLQDEQRAMIRFLLNLTDYVPVLKHEYYNNSKKTWEMKAVCMADPRLGCTEVDCKHCQTAKERMEQATSKEERKEAEKMLAKKLFVWPVYLYGIKYPIKDTSGRIVKDEQGHEVWKVVTYKDKENKEHPQSGIRYIAIKGTAPLFTSLRENFRMLEEGDSFLNHDITISLACTNGDILKPVYTPVLRAPSQFVVPEGVEIPEMTKEAIFERLVGAWEPISTKKAGVPADPFPPSAASSALATKSVPDF
jgi:hypothetical protein